MPTGTTIILMSWTIALLINLLIFQALRFYKKKRKMEAYINSLKITIEVLKPVRSPIDNGPGRCKDWDKPLSKTTTGIFDDMRAYKLKQWWEDVHTMD